MTLGLSSFTMGSLLFAIVVIAGVVIFWMYRQHLGRLKRWLTELVNVFGDPPPAVRSTSDAQQAFSDNLQHLIDLRHQQVDLVPEIRERANQAADVCRRAVVPGQPHTRVRAQVADLHDRPPANRSRSCSDVLRVSKSASIDERALARNRS